MNYLKKTKTVQKMFNSSDRSKNVEKLISVITLKLSNNKIDFAEQSSYSELCKFPRNIGHNSQKNEQNCNLKYGKKDYKFNKPCRYAVRGNCTKVNCPFRHDIKNIRCKFWAKGGCVHEECPFFHEFK